MTEELVYRFLEWTLLPKTGREGNTVGSIKNYTLYKKNLTCGRRIDIVALIVF